MGIDQCSQSFAVATAEAVEAFRSIKTNGAVLKELSVEQLVNSVDQYSSMGLGNMVCQGSSVESGLNYAMQNPIFEKAQYKSDYHYGVDTSSSLNSFSIDEWQFVRENSAKDIKAMLQYGPVIASIHGSSKIFLFYKDGIIDDTLEQDPMFFCNHHDGFSTDHAVTIVGFGMNPKTGKQYFIIKNSFGEKWGQKGYAKISLHSNTDMKSGSCRILSYVAAPVLFSDK